MEDNLDVIQSLVEQEKVRVRVARVSRVLTLVAAISAKQPPSVDRCILDEGPRAWLELSYLALFGGRLQPTWLCTLRAAQYQT